MEKLQLIGISPVSLHVSTETLKSNISETYKAQGNCLKKSGSYSFNKNDMKEKVNDMVRLHVTIQEKLKAALYLELVQIHTNHMYC